MITITRFRFLVADDVSLYGVTADGALLWWQIWGDGQLVPSLAGGTQIGVGWGAFAHIVPGGEGMLYAVSTSGALQWYKDLFRDGSNAPDGSTGWASGSGNQIGTGWDEFSTVLSGDDGVLYGIKPTGEILWYRDLARDGSNAPNGSTGWAPASGSQIDDGWDGFLHVVSGGGGVIYAVAEKGDLLWYRDDARDGSNGPSGATGWAPGSGSRVGRDWDGFLHIFAGSAGVLYACQAWNFGPILLRYRDELGDGGNGPSGAGWSVTADLANSDPTRIGWQVAALEGYCWPPNISTGETIRFFVSSMHPGQATATVVRLGGHGPRMGVPVSSVGAFQCEFQAAGSYGSDCGWSESFELTVPADSRTWEPGFYAARVRGPGGARYDIPFIVSRESTPAPLALLVNTNTWASYNTWGGASNYTSAGDPILLTVKRPNHHLLSSLQDHPLGNHLIRAEIWLISWLRAQGYQVDLYTDLDLEAPPPAVNAYKALIIGNHPEYWTQSMIGTINAYLDGGGSLIYFGGNGMYRPTTAIAESGGGDLDQLETRPVQWDSYPQYEGMPLLCAPTENLRMPPAPGVGFLVGNAEHRFMPGGVAVGDQFGTTGWNSSPSGPWNAVGLETDVWSSLPPSADVLAQADAGEGAAIVCHDTTAGGFVLGAGSITFVGSLMEDPVLQQIMMNALAEALIA